MSQSNASASTAQSSASAKIGCPKCGEVISIAQALGAEIEQKLEREFRTKMLSARQELETKVAQERQQLEAKLAQERQQLGARFAQERQELERKLREDLAQKNRLEFDDLKAQVLGKG